MRLHGRTAPARGLFVALLVSAAALCAPAQAQLVYLHSPAEEKAANEVKEGLEAARKSHLEAIDAHRSRLEEVLKRERQAIAQRELALRDARIVEIFEGNDRSDKPLEEAQSQIGARLTAVTGVPRNELTSFVTAGGVDLLNQVGDIERARIARDIWSRTLKRAITSFQKGGGKGTYCDVNGLPAPALQTAGSAEQSFAAIRLACNQMRIQADEEAKKRSLLPPEAAALLGYPMAAGTLRPGEVRAALELSESLTDLETAQKAIGQAAQDHLEALDAYHQCQVKAAAAPTASQEVQTAAKRISDFLSTLNNLTEKALTAPDTAQDDAGAGADCQDAVTKKTVKASPVLRSGADLLRESGLTTEQIDSLLQRGQAVAPGRSLLAGIQEQAQAFHASKLGELASGIADPATETDEKKKKAVASLLRIIDNVQTIHRARNGTLPDTAAVLVRQAAAKMKAGSAKIEAQRLKQARAIADLQLAALRRETLDLIRAYHLAHGGGRGGLERALMIYSDSWGAGRMPNLVLKNDMKKLDYLAWADRERVAVEASYAVLEPAVAELQAYGASGFKAAEIAGFLHAIGAGATALGGN